MDNAFLRFVNGIETFDEKAYAEKTKYERLLLSNFSYAEIKDIDTKTFLEASLKASEILRSPNSGARFCRSLCKAVSEATPYRVNRMW